MYCLIGQNSEVDIVFIIGLILALSGIKTKITTASSDGKTYTFDRERIDKIMTVLVAMQFVRITAPRRVLAFCL